MNRFFFKSLEQQSFVSGTYPMVCPVPCENHFISSCRAANLYCKMLLLMGQKKNPKTLNKIMFCKFTCSTAFLNLLTPLKPGIEIFSCNLGMKRQEQTAQEQTVLLSLCVCAWVSYCRKTPFSFSWLLKFMQLAGISSCNCELLDVNPSTFFL